MIRSVVRLIWVEADWCPVFPQSNNGNNIEIAEVVSTHFITSTLPRTPPDRRVTPSKPTAELLGQVLPLRDQALMNRAAEHRDARVPDLVADVQTGQTESAGAGRSQTTALQVVPRLRQQLRSSSGS